MFISDYCLNTGIRVEIKLINWRKYKKYKKRGTLYEFRNQIVMTIESILWCDVIVNDEEEIMKLVSYNALYTVTRKNFKGRKFGDGELMYSMINKDSNYITTKYKPCLLFNSVMELNKFKLGI